LFSWIPFTANFDSSRYVSHERILEERGGEGGGEREKESGFNLVFYVNL
jgi:hypothetical protein